MLNKYKFVEEEFKRLMCQCKDNCNIRNCPHKYDWLCRSFVKRLLVLCYNFSDALKKDEYDERLKQITEVWRSNCEGKGL